MKNILFPAVTALLYFLFSGFSVAKDKYNRIPDVDITHYTFHIAINDTTDHIEGLAEVSANLMNRPEILVLDLTGIKPKGTGMRINGINAGSTSLVFRHENDRIEIEIPETNRNLGKFSFSVRYSGTPDNGLIISKNKFGERTFFGDNWPDRARNWLPCVDHPSDKATVDFIISAPDHYKIVGNGYLFSEYPETGTKEKFRKVTHWKEEVAIPTKVMVFGAANFAWEMAGFADGTPVQSWVYAQNREAGFLDYSPATSILSFYQDLIGPYSFEKLANVQSKTMFGGMENSGCIFYHEGSVTGKNKIQSLLAHEIAHQWFGDAVTEGDWHHVWLSEGFATYLEAFYADSLIPGRKLDASMADMRRSVIRFYEKTHMPVIDTTITNFMDLLSTNSYQKGAWVLHMLRQEIGEDPFWTGIRKFYSTYRDKNAMTKDFQSVMEGVAGRSLEVFFHQWLEIPGQPVIEWEWSYSRKKKQVTIEVTQIQDQCLFEFNLPLKVSGKYLVDGDTAYSESTYYQVPVTQRKTHIILPSDFTVDEVFLDPNTVLLFQEANTKK